MAPLRCRSRGASRPSSSESTGVSRCRNRFAARCLLSMPQMQDPNFARTVVLLCDYGPEGAFGLVLNRPTEMPATAMVRLDPPIVGGNDMPLWIGGPVEPQRGWILLVGGAARGGIQVHTRRSVSLHLAGSAARRPAGAPRAARARARRLRGLGTRSARRRARAVRVADGRRRSRLVFDTAAEAMWESAIRRLGADPSALTTSHGVH